MKAVFMGTPSFALPCLQKMIDEKHEISAVFCQPDRPKGRGYKTLPPPVKLRAREHGLKVFQPVKLRDGEVQSILKNIAPDVIVVVAYGRKLPTEILEIPKYGCINVHASLLPHLRGAAPIQWSIINGDKTTGVTTMYMADGIDTGDIILQRSTPIAAGETSGELFERLSVMGGQLLSETLSLLGSPDCPRTVQDESLVSHAPVITKEMAILDFNKSAADVCNLIHGLNPSPMAKTYLDGKLLRILKARPTKNYKGKPGEIIDDKHFIIACGDGAIEAVIIQPEGKKPMEASAYICGHKNFKGKLCSLA